MRLLSPLNINRRLLKCAGSWSLSSGIRNRQVFQTFQEGTRKSLGKRFIGTVRMLDLRIDPSDRVLNMPILRINTNVARSAVPPEFLSSMSAMLAETLGKSQEIICIHVDSDQLMSFGGSDAPTAHCSLHSIGGTDPEKNKVTVSRLSAEISKGLGIDKQRILLILVAPPPEMVALGDTLLG